MFFGFTKDMGIDLGTANTLIYMPDKGIVVNEPSVIARDNYSGKIIAVGVPAKEMLGKAPNSISVVRPLQDGVISDFDMTAEMLRELIRRALAKNKTSKLRVVVGVPSGVTEVEKRAVEEVVRAMGAKEVYILYRRNELLCLRKLLSIPPHFFFSPKWVLPIGFTCFFF